MTPTDHKSVLRALAEKDGCQASLKAAAHIEYIERRLTSALDRVRHLQQKLHSTRQQRNELRQQLKRKQNAGISTLCADYLGGVDDRCGHDNHDCNAAVELV
jgi:predicted transcriptional regulator